MVNSYLVFQENSLLNFTNNSAKHKGGAIFVEKVQYVGIIRLVSSNTLIRHSKLPQSAKAFLSG